MTTLLRQHKADDESEPMEINIASGVVQLRAANGGVNQVDLLQAEREAAKLLYEMGSHKQGLDILSGSVVGHVQSDQSAHPRDRAHVRMCGELCAKSLLHIVKWLVVDHKSLAALASQLKVGGQGDDANVSPLVQNLKVLLDLEKRGLKKDASVKSDSESNGKLLEYSVYVMFYF